MRAVVPAPGSLSMVKEPPWRSTMSDTCSSPLPESRPGLSERARSTTRRRTDSSIPTPLSRTSTATHPDSSLAARMVSVPPSGIARHRVQDQPEDRVAELEGVALYRGQRRRSWTIVITMPRRWASSRQRGAVMSRASAITAGSAHRPERHLGLARHELLEPPHRDRGLERDVAHDGEPALRGGFGPASRSISSA